MVLYQYQPKMVIKIKKLTFTYVKSLFSSIDLIYIRNFRIHLYTKMHLILWKTRKKANALNLFEQRESISHDIIIRRVFLFVDS